MNTKCIYKFPALKNFIPSLARKKDVNTSIITFPCVNRYDRGAYSRYGEGFLGKKKLKPSLEMLIRAGQVARGNVSIRKESMSKVMGIEIAFSSSRMCKEFSIWH